MKKDFIKKYQKLTEILSKIMDFVYTALTIIVTWQTPKTDEVLKLFYMLSNRILITHAKTHIDCICRFFHEFFYDKGGGWYHPPKMPLTVNVCLL